MPRPKMDKENASDPEGLSEYEKIRERNIQTRERMFRELQITTAKDKLNESLGKSKGKTSRPSKRGLAAEDRKGRSSPAEPVRKAMRLQKLEADGAFKLPEKEPTAYATFSSRDEHPR